MATKADFFDILQIHTERYLTNRKTLRRIKREKQRAKNPILDWIEAFLWAAAVVLLINQYLFQAYQIPSGSMIDTLLIGDRVFVNKIVYGPELLPGVAKLPSPFVPKRNQIIIFENPSHLSRGPVFDILQRIIYMLTLSLVDINRDEDGEPRAQFLIKRAVGMAGDRFVISRGELKILFPGETRWVDERDFIASSGMHHTIRRLIDDVSYPALEAAGAAAAYADLGLPTPGFLSGRVAAASGIRYPDYIAHERARLEVLRAALPHDRRYAALASRHSLGWYVPEGRIFPLGDNRDNSRDARYFGPVRVSKVLGQGVVRYWPIGRIGPMR